MNALKDDAMEADERAAFDWLRENIANEGAIWRSATAWEGERRFWRGCRLPLACAVSYYGGGIAPNATNPGLLGRAAELRCPVAAVLGRQG